MVSKGSSSGLCGTRLKEAVAGAILVWVAVGASHLRAQCPLPDPGFREPPCHYRQPDLVGATPVETGSLGINLNMQTTQFTVAGRRLRMAAYSGSLPGPTIRVRRGDTLRIRLSNNMQKLGVPHTGPLPPRFLHAPPGFIGTSQDHQIYTNLHTHGLQVSPKDPGDNVLLFVRPGQWHDYQYKIADGKPMIPLQEGHPPTPAHPTGLFWYHPHFHGSTTHQGWQGLSGALIVEGEIDEVPAVKAARERLIILNELWVGEDGSVPSALIVPIAGWSPFTAIPAVTTDILFTINGVYQPEIKIQEGETQRWRVLAAGPHRFFWLEVEGHELYQIAQDGIPFDKAKRVDRILLATGNRAEFIIKGGSNGRYSIKALAYEQGHPGGLRPERLLGTLVSEGKAESEGELPGQLVPAFNPGVGDLPRGPKRLLTFQGDVSSAPVKFTIDDREFPHLFVPTEMNKDAFMTKVEGWTNCEPGSFDPPQPIECCEAGAAPGTCDPSLPPCCNWSHQNVLEGRVEEWILVNQDVFQHPFHLHVNPFQVREIGGAPPSDPTWKYREIYGDDWDKIWWDVFRLPAAHWLRPGEVVPDWLKPQVRGEMEPGKALVPGWVRLRIYFRPDAPGLTVYHCHILPHEDNGMMGSVCIREGESDRCTPQLWPNCTLTPDGCPADGGTQ